MRKTVLILAYIILSITVIVGQSSLCPVDYSDALMQTEEVCDGTARNQACYGNNTINLVPHVDTEPIKFDSPGDMTDVEAIRALSLSALDETSGEWGIAMLRLLANLDPTATDDVTVLLFGDVEIESTANYANSVPVNTVTFANLRRYPNTTASVMSSVPENAALKAVGRLEDNTWIQVVDETTNVGGWIFADLLTNFEATQLDVVEPSKPYFGPMQAFYYSSESHDSSCTAVPSDGLFIQTPEGVGRVTIWINEVTIDFVANSGSTAYVEAPTGNDMTIDMLEGGAYVESETGGYMAVEGSTVTVTPSNANQPAKVNPPKPTGNQTQDETPTSLLSRAFNPSQPATTDEIAASNGLSTTQYDEVVTYGYVITPGETNSTNDTSNPSDSGPSTTADTNPNTNSNNGNGNGNSNCPGNSCNNNGNGNSGNGNPSCPGNSCNSNGNGNNGNNGNGNGNNGNGNNGNGNGNSGNNGNGNGNSGNNGNGNGNSGNNGNGNGNNGNNGNGKGNGK